MIISASRRTDLPAFYSDWLLRRLRDREVLIPNPRNPKQMGRVRLSPDNVDCIVFWSKNPEPMLDKLDALDALGYRYYFSFTLTAYGKDLERDIPHKAQVLDTFRRLSDRLGPARVDWRFDPVVIHPRYPESWHLDIFGEMCKRLQGRTERCIMNFAKMYRHLEGLFREADETQSLRMAGGMARIASEYGIPLITCSEKRDPRACGIERGACIDSGKIERLAGYPLRVKKDPGQPEACHCAESVDIGMYDTCPHACVYCYATTGEAKTRAVMADHDPSSPMLIGRPTGDEKINDRTRPTQKDDQLRLF